MATRDRVVLFLNGERREVHGSDCLLTLSNYLRCRLGLVGTKIVCSEGDCGSCTVLVGQPDGDTFCYRPIDSCIRFMFQLDGVHVVTVEGLLRDDQLSPVQQAMVECHGSQCGFCTPGFVVAMTGFCEETTEQPAGDDEWRCALTGNLCRCTGYTPILQAGRQIAADVPRLNDIYPPAPMLQSLTPLRGDALDLRSDSGSAERRVYGPTTVDDAVAFRAKHPEAKIVAGATDVGVQFNKRVIDPVVFLDLNRVAELEGARIEEQGDRRVMVAGARATWTELLEICRNEEPEFAKIVAVFGSPQIRHVGTIGGNIINASPIADSTPFLFVMEAELELAGPNGSRRVNINDFYRGYKQFDLRPDELLKNVRIPLPRADEMLRLFKVSRRRDLDISTFTGAIRLRLDGDQIADVALAYGAVGPMVVRLTRTEQFLRGRAFDEPTMQSAGDVAVEEITPISDVRGSADYRYQLARNVLLKFYYEQQSVTV